MHSIVIGPGLGRNPQVFEKVKKIITHARSKDIPLVIDAVSLVYFGWFYKNIYFIEVVFDL